MKKLYPGAEELALYATEAGRIMLEESTLLEEELLRGVDPTEWKPGDNTPVTRCDKRVNRFTIERAKIDYPEVTVLGEEEGPDEEWRLSEYGKYVFVLDPNDGSFPFKLGLPFWTFCGSVIDIETGRPVSAIIHSPQLGLTWVAEKGRGAFLNGRRLHVNDAGIERAYVSVMWWKGSVLKLGPVCDMINDAGGNWNNHCAVAICGGRIAEGRLENASVFAGPNAWETPAIDLHLEEAGGKTTTLWGDDQIYDFARHPETGIILGPPRLASIEGHIASNGNVRFHDTLLDFVAQTKRLQIKKVEEVMIAIGP